MRKLVLLLCTFVLLTTCSVQANPIADLQHLLDNAGYDAGPADGAWGRATASALVGFARQYGIDVGDTSRKPDDAAITSILDTAKAKLDAAYAAYPTEPLPQDYFVGVGDQQFIMNERGPFPGVVNRNGHRTRVTLSNYHAFADGDIEALRAAGAKVIRVQLGMDGALLYDKCKDVPNNVAMAVIDACYAKAYAASKANKWAEQNAALSHFGDNIVVKRFLDGVATLTKAGFHVMIAPSDFYNGGGSDFSGTAQPSDPLFHVALMRDPALRAYYPRFIGALVEQLKRRGLTNVSMQTANEPRFCTRAGPTRNGLSTWTAIETEVIDQVRRVAPRMSIVSSAICLEGVRFFGQGHPFTDIARIMPDHPDIDNISYSLHLYTPGAVMEGSGLAARYKPGTPIHYPYKYIPLSAALNGSARHDIKMYDRTKPDAKYWNKVFADIAAFSAKRKAPVIITEMSTANPSFGVPRDDRVALERDLIQQSMQHSVAVIRFGHAGYLGLSSCRYNQGISDHRFDPALMNLIAFGNSVPGAKADAPIAPLDATCGPPVTIQTDETEDHSDVAKHWIDSIFRTVTFGPNGAVTGDYNYNIQGSYTDNNRASGELFFSIITPALGKKVPSGLKNCAGTRFPSWDGAYHLNFRMFDANGTMRAPGLNCILKNTRGDLSTEVSLIGLDFKKVAADMVSSGTADMISNARLKQWISDIADGSIVIKPPRKSGPVKIDTYEIEDHSNDATGKIDSILKTRSKGGNADHDFNIQGYYSKTLRNFPILTISLVQPALDDKTANALVACRGVSFPSWDGKRHLKFSALGRKGTLRIRGLNCILKNTKGELASVARLLGQDLPEVAAGMVSTGSADDLTSGNLRQWIHDIADGAIVLEPSEN